jgi:hypothetical protein
MRPKGAHSRWMETGAEKKKKKKKKNQHHFRFQQRFATSDRDAP